MKKLILINIICCQFIIIGIGQQGLQAASLKTTLSGKVTEAGSGQPVAGATVYINELKTGTLSDPDGHYAISNLPETKLRVNVSCIGYKMKVIDIDLATTKTLDVELTPSVAELSEIVVTGHSRESEKNRTPTPISTIPSLQLQQSSATNIIDAISSQPGINQVTTGAAISKPVIRGLGFNRVVVVNDGIRQEGQQWGDEHGIEVDEFAVNHVEILKGPASLMYGSDAMAGVINFLSAPTLPKGTIEGKILGNYQTNNGLAAYSLNLAGNNHDVIWNVRWSEKLAHAYQNKYDGFVLNSGFQERTFSGIAGFNKAWGYSHLHFSFYHLNPGIVEGERDSITGAFVKPVAENDSLAGFQDATNHDFKSYDPQVPYQEVDHYKLVLNNNLFIGDGNVKFIFGWQQNRRKEFGDVIQPDQFGLYFLLNAINYDVRYDFAELKGINFSTGLNGMYQQSLNKGNEFLIPEYHLFDAGIYLVAKKSYNKIDISGGIRFDNRNETGESLFLDANGSIVNEHDPQANTKFSAFNTTFNGWSGSLGVTYQVSEIFFTKFNVSRGYRAPDISELGSNGEHEGSGRYEIGNQDLKPEQSVQFDFALGINSEHVTGEINLFNNSIDDFIFSSKINAQSGTDSLVEEIPVFKFTSGNARLRGGEVNIDIHPHPLDWLHFENTFSYVEGILKNQPDSAKYLPFIPASKITSELKGTTRKLTKGIENGYLKLGCEYSFSQDHVYSLNNTETPTGDYMLFNVGAGADFTYKKKIIFSLYIAANNLLDESYQNHLSRLKYTPENYATGRTGIFNMGRNFSFKVIIPVRIRE